MLKWMLVLISTLHSLFAALHILHRQLTYTLDAVCAAPWSLLPSLFWWRWTLPHRRPRGITVETYTTGGNGTLDRRCCGLICINIRPWNKSILLFVAGCCHDFVAFSDSPWQRSILPPVPCTGVHMCCASFVCSRPWVRVCKKVYLRSSKQSAILRLTS